MKGNVHEQMDFHGETAASRYAVTSLYTSDNLMTACSRSLFQHYMLQGHNKNVERVPQFIV